MSDETSQESESRKATVRESVACIGWFLQLCVTNPINLFPNEQEQAMHLAIVDTLTRTVVCSRERQGDNAAPLLSLERRPMSGNTVEECFAVATPVSSFNHISGLNATDENKRC